MSVIAKKQNARRKRLVALSCLFLAIFGASLAVLIVRLRNPDLTHLRNSTIAKCEENKESEQLEAELPKFKLISSHHFDGVDGQQYEALVFRQFLLIFPGECIVKVVVVDKSYSVIQSEVVTRMYRKYLTGKPEIEYHSDGVHLKIKMSGDSMSSEKIQMIVPVSPRLRKAFLQKEQPSRSGCV